ncbi:MAG TPA: FG-GAP-like repeat-containing protein [Pyrinomonadaceae bacterium]|jgi:uncharacterized delta-60 repeat protein
MLFSFGLVFCLTISALAAPADLDTTFGTGGKVFTNTFNSNEEARAVVVQPDGKLVVVGYYNVDGTPDFMVARYNTDGSPDTSFDADGRTITPIFSGNNIALAAALQPDGKIVVAGFASNGTNSDFALVRYNTDGSLDTTFDTDGIVTTPILSSNDIAFAVAVQPDGKIVAAGSATTGNSTDFALARYNPNGSLDSSFDTDGKLTTPFFNSYEEAYAVALQPDGKIVAVGYTNLGVSVDYAVARYNTDGSLDTSFDADGKVNTQIFTSNQAYAVAIQPDGKLVIAGYAFNGGYSFALVRYNQNGSLDNSFDTDGKVTTSILGNNDVARAVAVQPDGKIVAAGFAGATTQSGTDFEFALVRYNQNGSLDNSFDTDGKALTHFSDNFDIAYGAAIQPDGRIVVVGYTESTGVRNFALARYLGDARPNRTANFDADTKTDISVWNPADGFWYAINSSNNTPRTPVQWGSGALGDLTVPGDYDGDGKTDIAVWRASEGNWYIIRSSDGTSQVVGWGQSGDYPAPGDYDADGKTDTAIFRASEGTWYIRNSGDNSVTVKGWGANGDQPVAADYDGDGQTDIAVFRQSEGNWYIITSRDRFVRLINWGTAGDKPVAADYDGDGRTDIAVFRPNEGAWYIRPWAGNAITKSWGNSTDKPVAADYDGDGRADISVYRPSELNWYIIQSATNTVRRENLGQPGVPVPSIHPAQ